MAMSDLKGDVLDAHELFTTVCGEFQALLVCPSVRLGVWGRGESDVLTRRRS